MIFTKRVWQMMIKYSILNKNIYINPVQSLAFPFIPVQTHQYITDSKFLSCQSIDREFLFR